MNPSHSHRAAGRRRASSDAHRQFVPCAIAVDDLSVSYGDCIALRNLSVEVPSAGFTAVLGRAGSGKSTLLRALGSEVPWASGTIAIEGVPVNLWPSKKWTCDILSCPARIADDCPMKQCPRHPENISRGLRFLGLTHLESSSESSRSERDRSRLDLAMAIAPLLIPGFPHPKHLWLDEPLSGLDTLHQHRLLNWLQSTARQRRSTVVASPDYAMLSPYADHVILLAAGEVIGHGPAAITLSPRNLTRTFGAQPPSQSTRSQSAEPAMFR